METALITMEEQPEVSRGGFFNMQMSVKDVIQLIVLICGGLWFVMSIFSKIELMNATLTDLKNTTITQSANWDVQFKTLQNQSNQNSTDIQIMKKDVEQLKTKK